MAFAQRLINFSFTDYGINISGLRSSVHIETVGIGPVSSCDVRIWGMTLSHMNQISTLGFQGLKYSGAHDNLKITASSLETGLSLTYSGTIIDAYGDFQGAPDVPFHIVCQQGKWTALQNTQSQSFNQSSVQVSTIVKQLASKMGYTFENNGVNVSLRYPYLWGSLGSQLQQVCDAANCNHVFDNGVLAIYPKTGSRQGTIPLISPQTGMVGYPSFAGTSRISVKTLFNPQIKPGGQVQIQSSVTPANGTWVINTLSHDLESLKFNGMWFTSLLLWHPGAKTGATPAAGTTSSGASGNPNISAPT